MRELAPPALSVVIAIVSDTATGEAGTEDLSACVDALLCQLDATDTEIVVPYLEPLPGIEQCQARFPQVRFVRVDDLEKPSRGGREHHDALRARGVALTRGSIVALLEDHARPDRRWAAAMVAAHRDAHAGVGGAIENAIDRPLNWAVYFCDFGRYQNPVFDGDSVFASDANVSYKRSALETVRDVWRESFQETAVNAALLSRGHRLRLSSAAIVYQHRSELRVAGALRERWIWGRSYAASRSTLISPAARFLYAGGSALLPGILLLRMARNVMRRRRHRVVFMRCLPLAAALTTSWAAGEMLGYVTRKALGAGGTSSAVRARAMHEAH
jgi:hypothetical protein